METNYKITIPKPCHEDWNQMTLDETGRFCNSCVKSVVDFTNMKAPEIQEYFKKNQGESVCGRFKNEQLDFIIIKIPRDILFSQIQFHKVFILALLISIPEIVSCQNINGNRQKIDKVEVVDSASERSDIGKVKLDTMTQQNVEMTPERKSRVKELKKKREALVKQGRHSKNNNYGSMIMGKPALCSTRVDAVNLQNQTPTVVDKNFIYMPSTVEISPNFPGGISKFYEYFNSNFKVPIQNKNIKLIFSFVVDTDGSLVKIKLLRGINETLDKRAIEVVKASPKWIPGELSGQKVKVSYALPIKITP